MEAASSPVPISTPADHPASSSDVAALELHNLVPGEHWQQGKYLIEDVLPDITYGKLLKAHDVASGDAVIIRSFRVSDEQRARAWSRLSGYTSPTVQPRIYGASAEGRRIEVTAALTGRTLLDFFAGKKATVDDVRWLLGQLVSAVAALHELGVAHLNLKPTTVYVRENSGTPQLCIAGLETMLDVTCAELTSISVDPFYAPPEAIGLLQHHANQSLRAWDWWSVGRILQEIILGTHVVGIVIDRDVSRRTPELLIRADQFLREKDIQRSRPGGVELMPVLSEETTTLLRGLLTSCRDARWSHREITAWLDGKPVKERYELPRATRLYLWKDYAYSLPEIAECFSLLENRETAIEQIFATDRADSLFGFIQADSTQRPLAERLRELTELSANSAFANFPTTAIREILTSVSLGFVGGQNFGVRLRGKPVTARHLWEILNGGAAESELPLIEVLCEPILSQHLSHLDPAASRLALELHRTLATALAQGAAQNWLSRADRAAVTQVCAWLLREERELKLSLGAARENYAVTRIDSLNTLFQRHDLAVSDLAIVLFTLAQPEKFEYVTHAAWLKERLVKLTAEAEMLACALTWKNLGAVSRLGSALIGPIVIHLSFWFVVASTIALSHPAKSTLAIAIAILVGVFGVRLILRKLALRALLRRTKGAASSLPTLRECEEQQQLCLSKTSFGAQSAFQQEFRKILNAIKELAQSESAAAEIAPPEKFLPTRIIAIGSTALALGCVATFSPPVLKHPPQWQKLLATWFAPAPAKRSASATTSDAKVVPEVRQGASNSQVDPKLATKPSDKDMVAGKSDSRAKDAKSSKAATQMSWAFREPLEMPMMRTLGQSDATPEQLQAALEDGTNQVASYIPSSITSLIAVRVPTDDGVGLILFDGKSNKIADRHVYIAGYLPLARSWFMLGGKPAIYLGN